ncbi:hypothetical protein [Bdellovibrio bacteriovorus]|uniref:hypothetical protein n=1 Tax=Bdellovibrio bacteriovorus TaxID=959 RepID=UPI0035A6F678
MSLLKIVLLSVSLHGSWAQNSTQAVLPIGAIPKDSAIELKTVPTGSFFNPAVRSDNTETGFQKVDNSGLLQVKSITTKDTSSDTADLQALATNQQLVVQTGDLTAQNSNCSSSGDSTNCTITQDVPVYKTGNFDFVNWFLNLFGMGKQPSLVTPSKNIEKTPPKEAMALALEKTVTETNAKLAKPLEPSCTDNLPQDLKRDKTLVCGVEQALAAFRKGKDDGKITQEIFIFNDFSNGGVMGKMWFLNADGTPAKVVDKNPIWVSRGEGGFGNGRGTMRTPNGAVVTKAYRPPRNGNIKDGVELIGLEPENQDIFGRGVLLHGWDPYTPTQGCLGVAGNLDTRAKGNSKLGGTPPYLDIMKKGLLRNGGVMIYNFTPVKKNKCS